MKLNSLVLVLYAFGVALAAANIAGAGDTQETQKTVRMHAKRQNLAAKRLKKSMMDSGLSGKFKSPRLTEKDAVPKTEASADQAPRKTDTSADPTTKKSSDLGTDPAAQKSADLNQQSAQSVWANFEEKSQSSQNSPSSSSSQLKSSKIDPLKAITPEEKDLLRQRGFDFLDPSACAIFGVHISPGTYWLKPSDSTQDPEDSVIYHVGFSSPAPCSESLHLRLMVANTKSEKVTPLAVRPYSAPKDSGVDFTRYSYFFEIRLKSIRASPCAFNYTIVDGTLSSHQFNFTSNIYCSDQYKIVTFGQLDDSASGMQTIDRLRFLEMDLLIMTGNYGFGYHLDDGRLADRFFNSIEHITAQTVSIVWPGRRESFDDYQMFQSRFLYPSCKNSIRCDLTVYHDNLVQIQLLNLDQLLLNPLADKGAFLSKFIASLDQEIANRPPAKQWLMVFTNVNFYCSSQIPSDGCISNLYLLKEFEDVFELYGVHLVVSSASMNYESVRNVFNFEVRQSFDSPRNYVIAGIAGCHNFLTQNGNPKVMDGMSFSIENTMQSVVSIDIFASFYKMDLLSLPNFVSKDLRFMSISFDWKSLVYFTLMTISMASIIILFQWTDATKIGSRMAKRHAAEDYPEPEEELVDVTPVDSAGKEQEKQEGEGKKEEVLGEEKQKSEGGLLDSISVADK